MMVGTEGILIVAALLLLLSVVASKVSSWVGVPSLLIFLVLGMLAGSDGPGGIHFDDFRLAQFVGVMALVLILFGLGVV
jgi:cell volume regulation protein A